MDHNVQDLLNQLEFSYQNNVGVFLYEPQLLHARSGSPSVNLIGRRRQRRTKRRGVPNEIQQFDIKHHSKPPTALLSNA